MFLLLPIAFGNDQEALPLWREQGERESLAWEAGPGNEREGARRRARLRGQLDGLPDKRGTAQNTKSSRKLLATAWPLRQGAGASFLRAVLEVIV